MTAPHVEKVLRRWGLSCVYEGYFCLIHAILLAQGNPQRLELVTKCIYPDVARRCGLTPGGVDSAIRTAIRVACRRNGAEVARFCGAGGEPTVSQFLRGLYRCVQLSGGTRR